MMSGEARPPGLALLEHIDRREPSPKSEWQIAHYFVASKPENVRPFDRGLWREFGRIAVSMRESQELVLRAAMYVLSEGSPPDWYQLEFRVLGTMLLNIESVDLPVTVERVAHPPEVSAQIVEFVAHDSQPTSTASRLTVPEARLDPSRGASRGGRALRA